MSPCFRILATAHSAVADQGHLADVARLRGAGVVRFGPKALFGPGLKPALPQAVPDGAGESPTSRAPAAVGRTTPTAPTPTAPTPTAPTPTAPTPTAPTPTATSPASPTTPTPPGSTIPATVDPRRDVCLVAYRGTFDAAKITRLVGPSRQGAYAVVVVGVRTGRVRAVVLTDHLGSPFHHH